jgi:hypothetical protein
VTREQKERVWFILSIAYAGVRVLGANTYLVKYGLNIAVFATVEFVSSACLALSSSNFVRAYSSGHRQVSRRWAAAVLVSFAAPDIYAIVVTDRVPPSLLVLIGCMVTGSTVASIVGIKRRLAEVREARARDTDPQRPSWGDGTDGHQPQ